MRIQKQWMMSVAFMFVLLLCVGVSAFAQEPPQGTGIRVPAPPGEDTVFFISSEMSFDGKVVKGAPYSAQAITETTRTLGDGNKIKNKTTASIYRDGEGRTRREQELGAVGPWAVSGEPQQTVFINDPVTGVNYILDPRAHTARKMPPLRISLLPGESSDNVVVGTTAATGSKVNVRVEKDVFTVAVPPPADGGRQVQEFRVNPGEKKGTTESLGKQTIEGIEAEGIRTTMTIPAGEIGNEQPIQIISERWYSPELQVVVMSKHTDPLVGETVYRLTNIVRGEPSRSLFEVPADYTIKESPIQTRIFKKRSGEEK
ncbi:MAG: hypothetical protein QOC98_3290 [Frankiaceae bacterium]|jgi:hypothetical protein|nr:hypothetical protein [Frankiaceae bacterium]